MISAVGSPIGESDAVLAVAFAQLVCASKVCFGSPDFACRMNMGGYGLIPYWKKCRRNQTTFLWEVPQVCVCVCGGLRAGICGVCVSS